MYVCVCLRRRAEQMGGEDVVCRRTMLGPLSHTPLPDNIHATLMFTQTSPPPRLIPTPLTSAEQLLSDWPTPMVTPRPRLGTGRLYGPAVIPVGPLVTTLVSDDKTQCPT